MTARGWSFVKYIHVYSGRYSLLQDLPSLPRLKPERQRQVRVLWLFPSRQMSEQPPAFLNWSRAQAWLRTTGAGGAKSNIIPSES